jgi:hypothetical protein
MNKEKYLETRAAMLELKTLSILEKLKKQQQKELKLKNLMQNLKKHQKNKRI